MCSGIDSPSCSRRLAAIRLPHSLLLEVEGAVEDGMKAGLDGSCGGCSSSGADGAWGEVGGGANTANVGDDASPMTALKVRVKDGTTECWELRGAGGWRMNRLTS